MSFWKRLLIGAVDTRSRAADLALAVPRVFAGLALCLSFGLSKMPVPSWFVEDVGNLGFPLPALLAWLAVLSEVVGGIFLACGLLTRPSGLAVVLTMLVAALLQKAGDPLWERLPSLFFLVVAWYSAVLGSGRYGLDAWLRRPAGR